MDLSKINQPFDVEKVKQRKGHGGKVLDYVGWDEVVRRLNEELEFNWDWITQEVLFHDGSVFVRGDLLLYERDSESDTADDPCRRSGVGADKLGPDPDKSIKTAQAEALKKAGNLYGIALELWDEDHRDDLENQRKSTPDDDIDYLKELVYQKALEIVGVDKLAPNEVANVYGTDVESLQDAEILKEILETCNDE